MVMHTKPYIGKGSSFQLNSHLFIAVVIAINICAASPPTHTYQKRGDGTNLHGEARRLHIFGPFEVGYVYAATRFKHQHDLAVRPAVNHKNQVKACELLYTTTTTVQYLACIEVLSTVPHYCTCAYFIACSWFIVHSEFT